ncbi:hypothetical protein H0H87_003608 [Tephrocybe sp. NHM501043]|nr:hypothetical protein H0H87_003608 [Tephrocybe sp. NHM501043]
MARLLVFALLLQCLSTFSTPITPWEAAQATVEHPNRIRFESGLPVPNSTHSFWINTPGANPLAKIGSKGELTDDADVCIIGSGITGVSAAYHLAKALRTQEIGQVRAVILDARDFCSGATGRNGGHLTPVHFNHFTEKDQRYGREQAKKVYSLEHYTTSELVRIIKEHKWQDAVDLVSSAHVGLLMTKSEIENAKHDFAAARAAGIDLSNVEWLSADDVQATYGTSFPAFTHPGNNVWPLKLITHLFKLTQALDPLKFNLTLHTNTPVTSILLASGARRWSLSTPRGSIGCSYVLHATNGYASYLLPHLDGPDGIVPTRGQVMTMRATVPAVNVTKASWGGHSGFEYWFPRPVDNPGSDHPLVILGGGRDVSGPKFESGVVDDSWVNEKVGKALREFLPKMYPGMYEEGREPEMEWTGIMGYTKIGDPFDTLATECPEHSLGKPRCNMHYDDRLT